MNRSNCYLKCFASFRNENDMTIDCQIQLNHFCQLSEARTFWLNSLWGRVDLIQGSSERNQSYTNRWVFMFCYTHKETGVRLPPKSKWATLRRPLLGPGLLISGLTQNTDSAVVNQKRHYGRQLSGEHLGTD